ncbi:hypothetical protein LUZ63_018387 [Rhynchospora breviuscula]|uniref:Aminotransferase-like plant mobile domain-containing protein n=1 Tax=Rhynchospora breviuscula TaxID=2022672 RepID=A0A9Q0HHI1_9POAL|nr:hypothetical protein LUZ63_018387 [Rhynchospora breviuscula]
MNEKLPCQILVSRRVVVPVIQEQYPVRLRFFFIFCPSFFLTTSKYSEQACYANNLSSTFQASFTLTVRSHKTAIPFDTRFTPYLCAMGLHGVAKIGNIEIDKALITCFAERWNSYTHTFHLPFGEMTVTLQDITILLGLPVKGALVNGQVDGDWKEHIKKLLGKEPDERIFERSKSGMRLTWLHQNFSHLERDEDTDTVRKHARAYMLDLIGSVLLPDNSSTVPLMYLALLADIDPGSAQQRSWGSAVLSCLYHELCRDRKGISGPLLLLQLWIWTRFPFGRPNPHGGSNKQPHLGGDDPQTRPPYGFKWSRYHRWADNSKCNLVEGYREALDRLHHTEVNWEPYESELHLLPNVCTDSEALWQTGCPLINFWIVEYHNPERVMRQFGKRQLVPPPEPSKLGKIHELTRRDLKDNHWIIELALCQRQWESKMESSNANMRDLEPHDICQHDEYFLWYTGFTDPSSQLSPGDCFKESQLEPEATRNDILVARSIELSRRILLQSQRKIKDPDLEKLLLQHAEWTLKNFGDGVDGTDLLSEGKKTKRECSGECSTAPQKQQRQDPSIS